MTLMRLIFLGTLVLSIISIIIYQFFNSVTDTGFVYGLFHGLLIIPLFIISLFSDNVCVYNVINTGATYDLGFVIGILILGSITRD